ncbi:type I restriction endonuclease subunit R [Mycoplasma nasistruthionis]|uniref:Type I restriction enzyme endonuclease subunit n=1 Tax=Mycoplasma nasistruthionis TaxID=353852 RepID=A0A5B7XV92_9MOLU|nr:type I restriction endonuclease subunit R [Mycoplasma nasistruthionis]QCZ36597.1 type I restriction endonuclease subunit R [Mycoplasma nasistruthionis]
MQKEFNIANQNHFSDLNTKDNEWVILDHFTSKIPKGRTYQTEQQLEKLLIETLKDQGVEHKRDIKTHDQLLHLVQTEIERLNGVKFSSSEWKRFCADYLLKDLDEQPDCAERIQKDSIYDFNFDNGDSVNIKLIDKTDIFKNKVYVINQLEQDRETTKHNRYDVTILINGIPMIQIELKKRGENIAEAFNQIKRYQKESLNTFHSLYKYLHIFVISNGTFTRYFANNYSKYEDSIKQLDYSKDTSVWALLNNQHLNDLDDFAQTFLQPRVILNMIIKYTVFNVDKKLLILRPYQIAACEAIEREVRRKFINKDHNSNGGYIWHTTGSGKTLTSFKAAQLISKINEVEKVLFVVDRKDLDTQTIREFQKFSKDSVSGSKDTKQLTQNIESTSKNTKIVVTTIQKLSHFIKNNKNHPIFSKNVVLIFDECHRSQFGKFRQDILKNFSKNSLCQFGLTGTPIFDDNAVINSGLTTTASIFGQKDALHKYIITDAIRDEKVLKFNIDYVSTTKKLAQHSEFVETEKKTDLNFNETKLLDHPERIEAITSYILEKFNDKTARIKTNASNNSKNGFNALFAVSSIASAKKYYEEFKRQQEKLPKNERLKIAMVYTFNPNGFVDETVIDQTEYFDKNDFEQEKFDQNTYYTEKEYLQQVIKDYNELNNSNFRIDEFHDYYSDVTKRLRDREIDLCIVVNMLLTGFDAPTLNTLFIDKNLKYHGLIQAFSRTNRPYNKNKAHGNIVSFRDLKNNVDEALKLFANGSNSTTVLQHSYKELIDGYIDHENDNKEVKGFLQLNKELKEKFPNPGPISFLSQTEEIEFVKLFTEFQKVSNTLEFFDEFQELKSTNDEILSEREIQDYKSLWNEIRRKANEEKERLKREDQVEHDNSVYGELEFSVEIIRTDYINLEYILNLINQKLFEIIERIHGKLTISSDEEKAINKLQDGLKQEIENLLNISVDFVNKRDLFKEYISYLLDNKNKIKNNNDFDIHKHFTQWIEQKLEKEVNQMIQKFSLSEEENNWKAKDWFIYYIKENKEPSGKTKISNFVKRSLLTKHSTIRKVKNKCQELMNLFSDLFKSY